MSKKKVPPRPKPLPASSKPQESSDCSCVIAAVAVSILFVAGLAYALWPASSPDERTCYAHQSNTPYGDQAFAKVSFVDSDKTVYYTVVSSPYMFFQNPTEDILDEKRSRLLFDFKDTYPTEVSCALYDHQRVKTENFILKKKLEKPK